MFLWLDLETTGTDETIHPILEVAVWPTGPTLIPYTDAPTSWVVDPLIAGFSPAPWVDSARALHEASGLLREVQQGDGLALTDVETAVLRRLLH